MLYDNINYIADISYLTNVFIYEYDISKANINILFTKGIIDEKTYNYLYESPRMVRQVYVGKLCKDENISIALKAGIIEAKKLLFSANNIQDHEVLSIKNDAVFIIGRELQYTSFGLIKFVCKNKYTAFYKIYNMELYYYYNNINKEEYIDVKGISDDNLKYHSNYFLQFLKDIFYSIQVNGPEISLRMMKDFFMQYISLQLPVNYYRSFDTQSMYVFKRIGNSIYNSSIALESQKMMLDTNTNIRVLMEIQKIIMSIYFNKYR